MRGIPVYNAGVPRGIGVYGDVGFSNDEAGGGTAYALTGRAGFGPFGATAMLATYNPDGPADSDFRSGPRSTIGYSAGPSCRSRSRCRAGSATPSRTASTLPIEDVTELRYHVGVGFGPHHSQSRARHQALARSPAGLRSPVRSKAFDTDTNSEFALSGGLELNTLGGFGLHATYDAIFAEAGTPGVFGIGAHYTFRVPGL